MPQLLSGGWSSSDAASYGRRMASSADNLKVGFVDADRIKADTISADKIAPNSVERVHISAAAVGSAQIEDAAISRAKIETAAVGQAQIDALSVGTSEIKDLVVTEAKIADLAVAQAKIADLAVNGAKIANAAIGRAKIATAAVGQAQIDALSVGTSEIKDLVVESAKIAHLAVGSIKMADGAAITDKIANLAVTIGKTLDPSSGATNGQTNTNPTISNTKSSEAAASITIPSWSGQADFMATASCTGDNDTTSVDTLQVWCDLAGNQPNVPSQQAAPANRSASVTQTNALSFSAPGSTITARCYVRCQGGTAWGGSSDNAQIASIASFVR